MRKAVFLFLKFKTSVLDYGLNFIKPNILNTCRKTTWLPCLFILDGKQVSLDESVSFSIFMEIYPVYALAKSIFTPLSKFTKYIHNIALIFN